MLALGSAVSPVEGLLVLTCDKKLCRSLSKNNHQVLPSLSGSQEPVTSDLTDWHPAEGDGLMRVSCWGTCGVRG